MTACNCTEDPCGCPCHRPSSAGAPTPLYVFDRLGRAVQEAIEAARIPEPPAPMPPPHEHEWVNVGVRPGYAVCSCCGHRELWTDLVAAARAKGRGDALEELAASVGVHVVANYTAKLMVNGHGVASWDPIREVRDTGANGVEYAEEVARSLREAIRSMKPAADVEKASAP